MKFSSYGPGSQVEGEETHLAGFRERAGFIVLHAVRRRGRIRFQQTDRVARSPEERIFARIVIVIDRGTRVVRLGGSLHDQVLSGEGRLRIRNKGLGLFLLAGCGEDRRSGQGQRDKSIHLHQNDPPYTTSSSDTESPAVPWEPLKEAGSPLVQTSPTGRMPKTSASGET